MLCGVILPICLEGEEKPPCQQKLKAEDKRIKEIRLFDEATDILHSYWDGKTYDGFKITTKKVSATTEQEPYNTLESVDMFMRAGIQELQAKPYLQTN